MLNQITHPFNHGQGRSAEGAVFIYAQPVAVVLGIRVVIAESFERIHRSNLIGMGILPLEFPQG
ncbi:hypothetical protein ACQKEG_28550, partial [Klebsiella quasipneumoniae]